jgi:hypothetical protein
MLSDHLTNILKDIGGSPWISSSDNHNRPDVVKVNGILIAPNKQMLTCFVPAHYAEKLLANVTVNPNLSLMTAIILTYESYQLKGKYVDHRPVAPDELDLCETYIAGYGETVEKIGLVGDTMIKQYINHSYIAIRMAVEAVFEQTPKMGTGGQIMMPSV